MDVKNWSVIITGGGTGVGAAAARKLAAMGANLIINYSRSSAEAEAVAAECRDLGVEAFAVQGDVAKDEDCNMLATTAIKKFGKIDGLLSNAGVTNFRGSDDFTGLTAEDFLNIYAVNVVGCFQMTRAVTPQMRQQGRGSIVMTSSIAGVMGVGSSIAYAASKGALNTMTLSLARQLAPEIRVNAIAPGFITGRWWQEKMGDEGYDKMVAGVEASTPLQHAGTPEDMAELALFLLAGTVNITGEVVISDAGMHLGAGTPIPQKPAQ